MNVESHKRTLAIIHLVLGIMEIVFLGIAALFLQTFLPFIEQEVIREEGQEVAWVFDLISSGIFSILIVVVLFSSLPSIIGGIATLKSKEFGMTFLLIAGCLSLLSFPIGTAIGAYTIWVFVENNRKKNEQLSE